MFLSRIWGPKPLRHAVVTTFHRNGYEAYGRRSIESFLRHWPKDVTLFVYAENVEVEQRDPRLVVMEQTASLPKLLQFRKEFGGNPFANGTDPRGKGGENNFRWDAIRFCNKVFAVTDAITRTRNQYDQLVWLDADTVTHTDFPLYVLDKLAPRNAQLSAYLNRKSYPECGWVGYNLKHPKIPEFVERFEQMYLSGKFLELKESHDSFVFWHIVKDMERNNEAQFKYLGSDSATGHIFINSILGGYLDHLKGDRKEDGKSRQSDLYSSRKEKWWR